MSAFLSPERALAPSLLPFELPEVTLQDLLFSATLPVRGDLKAVEKRLRNMLESKVEGVPEMMAYLIESGGKRIRPLLTCLIARACGYQGEAHIPVACVAELLHSATLYHDDVVDQAALRRGRQTANHIFGNKVTVLAGDLMLAHCFSTLMDGGYFAISRALSRTVKQMVEGEILQLQCEENFETTLDQYISVIENKTASLFAWCGQAAGLIAGSSPEKSRMLGNLGYHLGIAFQLVDDLMDFLGSESTIGKDTLNDMREGKITLPLLTILKHHPELKEDLKKDFASGHTHKTMQRMQRLIHEPKVCAETHAIVQEAIERARLSLSCLTPSPYRTSLTSLLEYLAKRDR